MPRVETVSDAEARILDAAREAVKQAMLVRQAALSGDLQRELEDLYNDVVNTNVDRRDDWFLQQVETRLQRLLW